MAGIFNDIYVHVHVQDDCTMYNKKTFLQEKTRDAPES